ncbi:MAG: hypothetical protein LBD86_02140 [Spirochaetaceae bacterium]|jgi:hypothetical protein|nr:hypothetical protein [Spirochaetaceae bacterium]
MTENFDFYNLIRVYSFKNNSPYISIDILADFLRRNALRVNAPPQLGKWIENTREKIHAEISLLSDEGKCIVQGDVSNQRIFLPSFFVDKIEKFYYMVDETSERPFLSEGNLKTKIPPEYIREIPVETGMIDYLSKPQKTQLPVLKFIFPDNFGDALLLSSHIPYRILEAALSKLKRSMQKNRTLEFYTQKLIIHFPGQEVHVKEFIKNISMHHSKCIEEIKISNDFTFSSWLFLCPLIKTQVKDVMSRNNDMYPENAALYQAVTLIMGFNNYYKLLAINKRDRDIAFATIEEKMTEEPYMFTFNNIFKFTTTGGKLILQRYTEENLRDWINQKIMTADDRLPDIFKFTDTDGEEYFVRKDRVLNFCSYILKDLQSKIKTDIINRWTNILKNYYKERAMENDEQFEKLLQKLVRLYSPIALIILHDKRTILLQHEQVEGSLYPSKVEKFFDRNDLIPFRKLFGLRREGLLLYSKLSLPFWYSIPAIVSIARFFKHKVKNESIYYKETDAQAENDPKPVLKNSAINLAKEIVPDNFTIDEYMNSLIDRWNRLLNKPAQEKLTLDVNTTIKDYMRNAIKTFGHRALNISMLEELADHIINANPALSQISNKNALRIYIKVYITKTLLD